MDPAEAKEREQAEVRAWRRARPKFSDDQLLFLTKSPAFQEIYSKDKILDDLEAQRYDEGLEFYCVMDALGCTFQIGSCPIRGLTAGMWAMLWAVGSAYARARKPEPLDSDILLWMLAHAPSTSFRPEELPRLAGGFAATLGIDSAQADAEARSMIAIAFAPLALLPPGPPASEPVRYDSDWLVRVTGTAAQESGETQRYCTTEMPLSVVYWHCVNAQRKNDYEGRIRRRPDSELCRRMLTRSDELCAAYLAAHYHTQPSDESDPSDKSDKKG